MSKFVFRVAPAALALLLALPVQAAQKAPAHARPLPTPIYPSRAQHTEFVVEVNHMGQIVKVRSGKESSSPPFNAMTYGNVLQMVIMRPDGSRQTGLYKVNYDYDPHTRNVRRTIDMISAGGDWANEKGAVTDMLDINQRNMQRHRGLPGLSTIVKPTPTPKAKQ